MEKIICAVLICICPLLAIIIVPLAFWVWICKERESLPFPFQSEKVSSSGSDHIILDGKGRIVRNVSRYYDNPNGNYKGGMEKW